MDMLRSLDVCSCVPPLKNMMFIVEKTPDNGPHNTTALSRTSLHFLCPMEARGGQRWKTHSPEFKLSRRCSNPTARDSERARNRGAPDKTVTLAPTSRYLTDRQYVPRRPLFSAEQRTSILKKTHLQRHTEKEKQSDVGRREENQQLTDIDFLARARVELTPDSFSLCHNDIPPTSASREDLRSPMAVSGLRVRPSHESTLGSPLLGSRSAQQSPSSSILEVQRLNPPLRPRLSSTVLYPTYTPRSGYSRPNQTQLRHVGEGGSGGCVKQCSPGGNSKGPSMSPCQENYWACTIPKGLPPSPDRHSAGWDPDREYLTLLDYTYPLRPGQVVTEWNSSELHGDCLLQTDPNLQDSGIELDHLWSSTSLTDLSFSVNGAEQTRERNTPSAGHGSPDLQLLTKSSDDVPSSTPFSLTDPVGLSTDSLATSKSRGEMSHFRNDGQHHQRHALSSPTSTTFIRSTSVLPRSRRVCGEVDEEFLPLPDQLEELQLLSRQVREVTAQLSRPVTASWESLGPGTTSGLSSITLLEKQKPGDKEPTGNNQDTDEACRDETNAAQMAADHRNFEAVRRRSGAWMEPVGRGTSQSSLKEVEALVEQLSSLSVPSHHRSSQGNQSDSLMQHIQVFCSHLEQLIQRLYKVSEKVELLAAPTVDIDSVRACLAEYQSFQREVSSHQPLTSCVLHAGQLLLSYIDNTSPFLRDTLLLIERQSRVLETQTEHFFSSILSAMDSLTEASLDKPSRKEESGPVGVQGSNL